METDEQSISISTKPDAVLAVVGRGALSGVLTALHRAGHGHLTRVLDPERSDVAGQARRAGAEVPLGFPVIGSDNVAVLVSAPSRTATIVDLVRRHGADSVWEVTRSAVPSPLLLNQPARRPRARRGAHHAAD